MIRITKVCLLSLIAVALCASASQASISAVTVDGNGSLSDSGGGGYLVGDTSINFIWVDVLADETTPTDSASMSRDYKILGWWTSPAEATTVTASLTIEELLETACLGDMASNSITVKLEMLDANRNSLTPDGRDYVDQVVIANSVADGATFSDTTDVLLSVVTPAHKLPTGDNAAYVRLTVTAEVNATTVVCPPPPCDPPTDPPSDPQCPPVVPAPGAVVLASLGMGLVNWLRTRRTL